MIVVAVRREKTPSIVAPRMKGDTTRACLHWLHCLSAQPASQPACLHAGLPACNQHYDKPPPPPPTRRRRGPLCQPPPTPSLRHARPALSCPKPQDVSVLVPVSGRLASETQREGRRHAGGPHHSSHAQAHGRRQQHEDKGCSRRRAGQRPRERPLSWRDTVACGRDDAGVQ